MLEILAGTGLATAAGLNAGLPLLVLGALDRWTGWVELPVGWQWLSDGWVLAVLAVLVLVDVAADKVPGLDHVNDVLQTVVRPTAGGLAFGAGAGAGTVATGPLEVGDGQPAWTIAVGVVLALAVHLLKAAARPVVNAATVGVGGPVVSAAEDVSSLALSLAAVLLPLLVLVTLGLLVWAGVRVVRARPRGRARRSGRARPGDSVTGGAR